MAYKHQLSLEIPDTNNCTIFRVQDTSVYSENVPITCPTLEIVPPGFNQGVVIDIQVAPTTTSSFSYIFNSCILGLQTTGCGDTLQYLPDGVYYIRYSVSPNDKVFVEYKYLRVCQILNKYFNELCKLEMAACEPHADVKEQLKELRLIKSFIDAAKAKVEYCHDIDKGNELLMYADKRLNKYMTNDGCCTNCH
jgi:hypothetical protein